MKRSTFLLGACAGATGAPSPRAQAEGWAAAPSDSGVARHILPNGLSLLIREERSSRVAAASVFTRVSVRHESRALAGLRAFTQEMLLAGTSSLSRAQIADFTETRGGAIDVETGDDYAELFATGDADDLPSFLGLLGQLVAAPAFSAAEVERVRVELLARALREDDELLNELLQQLRAQLYKDSDGSPTGYGIPNGGFPESLRSIQRQHVAAFHRFHYVAPNMVVAVAGPVAAAEIARLTQTAFAQVPPRPGPAPAAVVLPQRGGFAIVRSSAPQAWLVIAYPVPGVAHDDYPPLAVLGNLLGRGMRSRLFIEFRQQSREALAYEVGSELNVRSEQCELVLFAQVDPLGVESCKDRILSHLARLQTQPVTAAELERARRMTVGDFVLAHQRNRQRAHHLALFETLGAGYQFDHSYPGLVRQVKAEDLQGVARSYLNAPTIALAMPEPLEPGNERSRAFR